jgi:hypothetical protein
MTAEEVRKLTDQSILADIAKNSCYEDMFKTAIKMLNDQSLLSDIAKNSAHALARLNAAKKLTDKDLSQEVFFDIVKNRGDYTCRYIAAENITDQKLLAYIVKNVSDAKDYPIRRNAVSKLTDQAALAFAARCDKDKMVRYNSAKKLTDKAESQEIMSKELRTLIDEVKRENENGLYPPSSLRYLKDELYRVKPKDLLRSILNDGRPEDWYKFTVRYLDYNDGTYTETYNLRDIAREILKE